MILSSKSDVKVAPSASSSVMSDSSCDPGSLPRRLLVVY